MLVNEILNEARKKKVTYTETEIKGKLDRVTATLEGADSKSFSLLAKKYIALDDAIKEMTEQRAKLNSEIKDKVVELFNTEDEVMTRVVETVSFTVQVAKQSGPGSTVDYANIIKDLIAMVPDLQEKVEALTKTYTKATKARDPALRVDSLKEGLISNVIGAISKMANEFRTWMFSYDKKLATLKDKFKSLKK